MKDLVDAFESMQIDGALPPDQTITAHGNLAKS